MKFTDEIGEALTLKFANTASEMKRKGRDIISLGLGEPDFDTPMYVVEAAIEALKDGYTRYSASQGLLELRELIEKKLKDDHNASYDVSEILISPGTKAALYLSLAAILEPFDKVVMITPYYTSYPALIKLAEPTAEIINVSLRESFSLGMEALEGALAKKPKCVILNSPHNPTGMVFTRYEVEAIIKMCQRDGIFIVSDEVYEELVYSGTEHVSFAKYPEIRDKLIVVNGYGKSHAMTGWRLGYAIGPKAVVARMNKIQQHINTNTCTFIQKGACAIYRNVPAHIRPYVEELKKRAEYFHGSLAKSKMLNGTMPKAGFFYFADISKTKLTSNDFCSQLLLATGIASTPGIAFGRKWDDHVRFSLTVEMPTLEKAVGLMLDFEDGI